MEKKKKKKMNGRKKFKDIEKKKKTTKKIKDTEKKSIDDFSNIPTRIEGHTCAMGEFKIFKLSIIRQ
jgi:hypothetical protein